VDVVTSGNHVYRYAEALPLLDARRDRLLRPANHHGRAPGAGAVVSEDNAGRRIAVLNLVGRVFMDPADDPFAAVEALLESVRDEAGVVLVDFHAEATSEKVAMGWFLDGAVSVVAGTHTHVPTADARILPRGTAYVTDIGMTGPHDSCLGVQTEIILKRFRTGLPQRFDVAKNDVRLQSVLVTLDDDTGRAQSVERVERRWE
jgi:metallophosphoesterase (TIGR00282 family)